MKKNNSIIISMSITLLVWIVFLLDYVFNFNFRSMGIIPRQIHGLKGIFLAPLLHASLNHIIANTGTLFILMIVSFSYSRKLTLTALWIIILFGGGMVWIFGSSNSNHIGASGVIFGLTGFLIFIGVFRKEWVAFFLSIGVFILYGGVFFSIFHILPNISWTGHFFGFISGIFAAWITKTKKAE